MDNLEREIFREIRGEQRDSQSILAAQGQRLQNLEERQRVLEKNLTEEDFPHRLTIVEERSRRLEQAAQTDQTAAKLATLQGSVTLLEERVMRLVTAAAADTTARTLVTLSDDVETLKKRAEVTADRWWKLGLAILEKVLIGAGAALLAWLAAKGKLP